jgi:ribonuclease PH
MRPNRANEELRDIQIIPNFISSSDASYLVSFGKTRVLCNATMSNAVPNWLKNESKGWISAEYSLLPCSTHTRVKRERNGLSGRTQEIQRLIGRSLRAVCNLELIEGCQITIDCDVLEADGGTRTASIVGAFLALAHCLNHWKETNGVEAQILRHYVSAVSVGVVNGEILLDLDYSEDSVADVDMNFVFASTQDIIEIQGSGEESTFNQAQLIKMLGMASKACEKLNEIQRHFIAKLP